jgi:phosphoglycerol transferase MdoB-like AlkP superfamily enzyme
MKDLAARAALHAGLWLLAFAGLVMLLRRPYFAASAILALQGLVVAVSQAKERVLREPLVFADLGLFSQALRHPRLYLPYFGYWRAAGAAAGLLLLIAFGLRLETPRSIAWFTHGGLLGLAAALLALGTTLAARALTLDPRADTRRFGLLGAMWLYALEGKKAAPSLSPGGAPFAHLKGRNGAGPHVVVVQSESFFDARRLFAGAAPEVLHRFDALAAEGECGRLEVPVWGAYTMRTEFAFLSGIANARLGVHRFNPYARFARAGVPTLASWLRARGYRTACVHPYAGSFFGRDRIFPALGFDAFLDAAHFAGARRAGPYVADDEIAAKLIALLAQPGPPWFLFAITMENHGPLHLEAARGADTAALYRRAPPPGLDDLTVYLRHLANADRMLDKLAAALRQCGDGVLCFYGDHVPGLPEVYRALAFDDPRTDYLVWRAGQRLGARADRAVESLGLRVLEAAGLASAPA